jgi:hypothetical protein
MRYLLLTGFVALVVSGCATQPCAKNQAYQGIKTTPKLEAPPGLQIPKPDSAYRIPDVRGKPHSFVYKKKGEKHSDKGAKRCLVMPPSMPSGQGGGLPTHAPKPRI